MQDPRYKHEYLDIAQCQGKVIQKVMKVTNIIARDRRYSCSITIKLENEPSLHCKKLA